MPPVILAIDCGTQSLRSMLIDSRGELLEKVKIEYEPYVSPKEGWAEQDPELFWDSLAGACLMLKRKRPGLFGEVCAVALTTQRDSMINMDKSGRPLRPAIIWLDQRKAEKVYNPKGPMRLVYAATGLAETLAKSQMDGKCNWIRQNQPEIWEKTHKYGQVSSFLHFRLTGNFSDSVAAQIGHIPFNYRRGRWAQKPNLKALLFPVEREKLVDLVQPGQVIGEVTNMAFRKTGIPPGTPVVACGSDKGCETLGMGVIDQAMASLSFGTTATVQTTSDTYFEPLKFMPAYPAPIPGYHNPEVEIFRGYWMITWFKNEFGHKEVSEARQNGVAPEVMLNKLLKEVPPGSMGLMVQPYWGPGLKNPSAKGAIIGFGDVHKRSHVYRAVIEGLAFALLNGLEKIEKTGGRRANRIAVSGGASQSDEICQISADIFNRPLVRGRTFETAGLGAAIVSAVGLGIHPSYPSAVKSMVHYDRAFHPNPDHVEIYKELYHRVYRKMYNALKHLYKEVRDIVNYPEKIL